MQGDSLGEAGEYHGQPVGGDDTVTFNVVWHTRRQRWEGSSSLGARVHAASSAECKALVVQKTLEKAQAIVQALS